MHDKKHLLVLALAACSGSAVAATNPTDARTNAMGGAAVAAGDYLSAGFHNPALAALDPDSAFGVVFPYLGAEVRDPDELLDNLDDISDAYDNNDLTAAQQAMRNAQGDQAHLDAGVGAAVGIPTGSISATLFTSGIIEGAVLPDIKDSDITTPSINPSSTATIVAVGVGELGVALASNVEIAGQRIAVGVSPKLQRITTYNYGVSVDSYDTDDWDDSRYREEDNGFNIDVGAVWQTGPYRVGLAGKNLISNDVDTVTSSTTGHSFTYEVGPQFTLGSAFVSDFVTIAGDIDLNKSKGFKGTLNIDDDTQFFRIGAEFDAFGHAQLRTGYRADMKDNVEDAFTLGLGLSPFGVVNVDIAASIIDSNSYGGSAQLAFTF
ncbi:conjugal transfer protein TraF [Salinivibrio proteolyticus]|uniref:Conjugal transfer protein TraF n=1 Tax=Salinivibrio proteolyticus TaxID=334715 RepID=A0ABY7LI73_9GAMM|nr:conjugal transfer protein TraF [Salinivibrio proteolyticus]WBA16229.1 conjugal transfer protein TraF [Salinivibrio proteolyticus]